jgi:hypothetical protein
MAALAFSAYGIHWFALGWNRYQATTRGRRSGLAQLPRGDTRDDSPSHGELY